MPPVKLKPHKFSITNNKFYLSVKLIANFKKISPKERTTKRIEKRLELGTYLALRMSNHKTPPPFNDQKFIHDGSVNDA